MTIHRVPNKAARTAVISQSISREAARLASAERLCSPTGDVAAKENRPDESSWSHVRDLDPPAELRVTRRGGQPVRRHFLRAGDSELDVLNLTDPAIPNAVRQKLLETAEGHSDYFSRAGRGETFQLKVDVGPFSDRAYQRQDLRLAPDGVFLADRKLADLDQIVEQIARTEIAEIRSLSKHLVPHLFVGAAVGALLGIVVDRRGSRYFGDAWAAAFGAGIGTGVGAGIGGILPRRADVIYRSR